MHSLIWELSVIIYYLMFLYTDDKNFSLHKKLESSLLLYFHHTLIWDLTFLGNQTRFILLPLSLYGFPAPVFD